MYTTINSLIEEKRQRKIAIKEEEEREERIKSFIGYIHRSYLCCPSLEKLVDSGTLDQEKANTYSAIIREIHEFRNPRSFLSRGKVFLYITIGGGLLLDYLVGKYTKGFSSTKQRLFIDSFAGLIMVYYSAVMAVLSGPDDCDPIIARKIRRALGTNKFEEFVMNYQNLEIKSKEILEKIEYFCNKSLSFTEKEMAINSSLVDSMPYIGERLRKNIQKCKEFFERLEEVKNDLPIIKNSSLFYYLYHKS